MSYEKIEVMDVHITHNLSTKENHQKRKKNVNSRDFYLSNFRNVATMGVR